MKRSRGFTLIEMMAVIIIFSVIALITVPSILNILKNNQKSTFKDSAYGIMKAGEVYYTNQSMYGNEMMEETTFTFPNSIEGLNFKGKVPDSGIMRLDMDGRVALALFDGTYCALKEYSDSEITVTKKVKEECKLSLLVFGNSKVPNRDYEIGTKIKYAKKNWLVIENNEEDVTVILEDILTVSEIVNALGHDLSSNDIYLYTNDKRWVRHCMSNPNTYQIEENKYCYYDNDLMEDKQKYSWNKSIVKTITENWLEQIMITANLNKEQELKMMTFSDGLKEYNSYIRIPTRQDIEKDINNKYKKASIEYWTLTWNKNTEHYSYIWGVVTDEKLFEDKSHFLAGVRPIIKINKK